MRSTDARLETAAEQARGIERYLATTPGILLLTVALRMPALRYPGPIDDEKVYGWVASELLQGALPYRDVIERKPPLLFWIYEAIFASAGRVDWTRLHIAGLLCVLATMLVRTAPRIRDPLGVVANCSLIGANQGLWLCI